MAKHLHDLQYNVYSAVYTEQSIDSIWPCWLNF